MAEEIKTVSLRLPVPMIEYIEKEGYGVNQGVKNRIALLQKHEAYADMELRGKFSTEEWSFMADILNGVFVPESFRFSKEALVSEIQDSQIYFKSADKWKVNTEALANKVMSLTAPQVDAVFRRVEKFWEHPETNLQEWSNF